MKRLKDIELLILHFLNHVGDKWLLFVLFISVWLPLLFFLYKWIYMPEVPVMAKIVELISPIVSGVLGTLFGVLIGRRTGNANAAPDKVSREAPQAEELAQNDT